MIEELENLPDISFIDNLTLTDIQSDMVADFEERYEELTGKAYTMMRADPVSLCLYAAAVQIYQAMLYIDHSGKMDLLKYSTGEYLDHLGALRGVTRMEAESAVVTMRFTLASERTSAIPIPQGTRVSDGSVYFATSEYAEIPAGDTYIDVPAVCMVAGTDGNLPEIGSITTLVDPIPYMQSVTNIDYPAGGTDAESDEDLRDRIFLAPSSYSVAGPEDAYTYWTQKYSSSISDVMVFSPVAGDVHVLIITEDGELPTQTQIDGLQAYLEDEEIRPLTDHVTVAAPELTSYTVGMTYYIGRSSAAKVTAIQDAVAQAVDNFVLWQQSKIGRDINPDQLINMVIAAGAKRVVLASPVFTTVPKDHVARISGEPVITYGGLEDD